MPKLCAVINTTNAASIATRFVSLVAGGVHHDARFRGGEGVRGATYIILTRVLVVRFAPVVLATLGPTTCSANSSLRSSCSQETWLRDVYFSRLTPPPLPDPQDENDGSINNRNNQLNLSTTSFNTNDSPGSIQFGKPPLPKSPPYPNQTMHTSNTQVRVCEERLIS